MSCQEGNIHIFIELGVRTIIAYWAIICCALLKMFVKRNNIGSFRDHYFSFLCVYVFLFIFFIQFNVPFKIISLRKTSQSIGGAKREYPGKTT